MQRRIVLIVFGVGIGSRLEQDLSGLRSIPHRRIVQRRSAHIVFGIYIDSRLEQGRGSHKIILPRRMMQRRSALIVFGIYIDSHFGQDLSGFRSVTTQDLGGLWKELHSLLKRFFSQRFECGR